MTEMQRIIKLAEQMRDYANEVERLNSELKEAKKNLQRIEQDELPDLMAELGLSEIKLDDGTKIMVEERVDAKITEGTKPQALDWLRQHGFAGLIKSRVIAEYPRGDIEAAEQSAERLADGADAVTVDATVHHQTLKAFVKEQMAAGQPVPFDLFNIHPYNVTKIQKG